MGTVGDGYGSEYHLRTYLQYQPEFLSRRVAQALEVVPTQVEWLDYVGDREFRGMTFLQPTEETPADVLSLWRGFWPQTGNPPNWDAIARLKQSNRTRWVLVEAKANHPEFCSGPCSASPESRAIIERAINRTKKHLGIHRHFCWLGSYYQYANRLACLYFLNEIAHVPTDLAFIYFTGDRFPNAGAPHCPRSEAEWHRLVEACHLTLGLSSPDGTPIRHPLLDRVHHVFVPVTTAEPAVFADRSST